MASEEETLRAKLSVAEEALEIAKDTLETANKGKDKKAKSAAETEYDSSLSSKEYAEKNLHAFLEAKKVNRTF
jgi:hypothetical protein